MRVAAFLSVRVCSFTVQKFNTTVGCLWMARLICAPVVTPDPVWTFAVGRRDTHSEPAGAPHAVSCGENGVVLSSLACQRMWLEGLYVMCLRGVHAHSCVACFIGLNVIAHLLGLSVARCLFSISRPLLFSPRRAHQELPRYVRQVLRAGGCSAHSTTVSIFVRALADAGVSSLRWQWREDVSTLVSLSAELGFPVSCELRGVGLDCPATHVHGLFRQSVKVRSSPATAQARSVISSAFRLRWAEYGLLHASKRSSR